jgi:hypothetical protein
LVIVSERLPVAVVNPEHAIAAFIHPTTNLTLPVNDNSLAHSVPFNPWQT